MDILTLNEELLRLVILHLKGNAYGITIMEMIRLISSALSFKWAIYAVETRC